MIRKAQLNDIAAIANIWYEVNINTHDFIPQKYWLDQLAMVKEALVTAEIYVYVKDDQILGFVGLEENYIAGIFIVLEKQSLGIGQKLLSHLKNFKNELTLKVYQKNKRAINFYQREDFIIQSESIDEATNEYEYVMTWTK